MKNKLEDLNDHLFEQLERLNDDDLVGEELQKEISRADAMSKIAQQIISNAKVELDATKYLFESGGLSERNSLPPMIEYGKKKFNSAN